MFLKFLFPRICVGCGSESAWLCERCAVHVIVNKTLFARQQKGALDGVIAVTSYSSPEARGLIKLLKYRGAYDVEQALHVFVQHFVKGFFVMPVLDALVPVPLHKRRLHERGFNQAEILARVWSPILCAPVVDVLERTRYTSIQAHLPRLERLTNMRDVFSVKQPCATLKSVALIDDVCTTGATLEACAHTLKKGGVERVFGLVFAVEE